MISLGASKDKQKTDDVKQVLEALTTTIESINVRLAKTTGDMYSKQILDHLQKVSSSMQYVYSMIVQLQKENDDIKKQLAELPKAMTKTNDPAAAQRMMILERKIDQLIKIQMEETKILQEQNEYLQKNL